MIGYVMDWQVVIQIVIGLAFAVGGYLYKELKGKVDKTHEEFLVYRTFVAEKYVTNDHLAQAVVNLNKTLETVAGSILRVEQRLNNQIDNSNHRGNNP